MKQKKSKEEYSFETICEAKEAFYDTLNGYLKELGKTPVNFETVDIKEPNFFKNRANPEVYISLDVITIMETLVKRRCNDLRIFWMEIEKHRKKPRYSLFFDLKDRELFWIVNNINELIKIPKKNLIFLGYLDLLNEKGKEKIKNDMIYLHDTLGMEKKSKYANNRIFTTEEEWETVDKLECWKRLDDILYDEKSIEERKGLICCWKILSNMNPLDRELYETFTRYGSSKQLSNEQAIMIAIVHLLCREP